MSHVVPYVNCMQSFTYFDAAFIAVQLTCIVHIACVYYTRCMHDAHYSTWITCVACNTKDVTYAGCGLRADTLHPLHMYRNGTILYIKDTHYTLHILKRATVGRRQYRLGHRLPRDQSPQDQYPQRPVPQRPIPQDHQDHSPPRDFLAASNA